MRWIYPLRQSRWTAISFQPHEETHRMCGDIRAVVLTVALFVLAGASRTVASELAVTSFGSVDAAGIERGIARVVCARRASKSWVRVRAVVLDVGESDPKRDVLAPAHGLPEDIARIKKDCRISGAHGPPVRIAEYWLPETRNAALGNDWLVLMTRSALKGPAGRLRAGVVSQSLLEQLLVRETPVAVMLLGSARDQRSCRILDLLEPRIFSHSCPGWAGLSGSPILIGVNGEPVVIGIGVAKTMRPLDVQGALFLGVGLAINDTIAAAIEQAAARARGRRPTSDGSP
jgi:hypothetical protein